MDKKQGVREKESAVDKVYEIIDHWLKANVSGGLQKVINNFFNNPWIFDIDSMHAG